MRRRSESSRRERPFRASRTPGTSARIAARWDGPRTAGLCLLARRGRAKRSVAENPTARLDGLRSPLSVMAVIALIALPFSRRIPA